jgi:hypothetical protein
MKGLVQVLVVSWVLVGSQLLAQSSAPQTAPVPLTSEHHHHLVFSSPQVRAFYVVIPAKDQTLIHQHDVDYLWVGLGDADVVNATVNKPRLGLHSKNGALHFSRGPFAHEALNVGNTVYRNVTIELLQQQNNPSNLCEEVLEGKSTDCVAATPGVFSGDSGVSVQPEFETDEIRFDTVTVDPAAKVTISGSPIPPLVIALSQTQAEALPDSGTDTSHNESHSLKDGDVMSAKADMPLTLRNTGTDKASFLVFEFKAKN